MPKDRNKKKVVQDVIPPKRSIRDVELPSRARDFFEEKPVKFKRNLISDAVNAISEKPIEKTPVSEQPRQSISKETSPSYKYEYDYPVKKSPKLLYVVVTAVIVATAFGMSALFKSADIRITPQQQLKSLKGFFSIFLKP